MELKDLDPRVRRFIEIRERLFSTHWTQRLGKHPEREFNPTFRALCDAEHRQAKEDYDSYIFWNFPLPAGTPLIAERHCRYVKCGGVLTGKATQKYCSELCRVRQWDLDHPESKKVRDAEGQRRKRQRLKVVPFKSA